MGQAAVWRRALLAAVASTFAGEPFIRQSCTACAMPILTQEATVLSSQRGGTRGRPWRRSLADAHLSNVNCGWEHHRGFFMSDYAKHPGQVHHAVFGSQAEAQSDCVRSSEPYMQSSSPRLSAHAHLISMRRSSRSARAAGA